MGRSNQTKILKLHVVLVDIGSPLHLPHPTVARNPLVLCTSSHADDCCDLFMILPGWRICQRKVCDAADTVSFRIVNFLFVSHVLACTDRLHRTNGEMVMSCCHFSAISFNLLL